MSAARTSRRRFIAAAGAALSAPLAGLGTAAVHAATSDGPLHGDVEAIRVLMHEHASSLGARPEGFDAPARIDIAAYGRSATAALSCVIDTETAIAPDCPLVEMARQQGGGVVRSPERVVLESTFVKRDGAWMIQNPAQASQVIR